MKKKLIGALTVVALLSVATAGIGKANAYFTTYAQARGGQVINLGDETEIKEDFKDWVKTVKIINKTSSKQAVWVRVQAFAGSQYPLKISGGESWYEEGAFWYYKVPLTTVEPDNATDILSVEIEPVKVEEGEEAPDFNVVIIYETTPAITDATTENGYNVKSASAADWNADQVKRIKES